MCKLYYNAGHLNVDWLMYSFVIRVYMFIIKLTMTLITHLLASLIYSVLLQITTDRVPVKKHNFGPRNK